MAERKCNNKFVKLCYLSTLNSVHEFKTEENLLQIDSNEIKIFGHKQSSFQLTIFNHSINLWKCFETIFFNAAHVFSSKASSTFRNLTY